jgi:hypothetical protein
MQTWSLSEFHNILLDARKNENENEKQLIDLKNNPLVPIGFIYAQIPGQPQPKTLIKP